MVTQSASSSRSSSSHQMMKSMALLMNSSAVSSSQRSYKLPLLQTLIFFLLFTTSSSYSVSSSASQISYSDRCASIIPESPPNEDEHFTYLYARYYTGYYTGGENVLNQNSSWNSNSLVFRARKVSKTGVEGVFKAEGSLIFEGGNMYYHLGNSTRAQPYYPEVMPLRSGTPYGRNSMRFRLHGYWSDSSGKLCMVGTGSIYSKNGNLLQLPVVLKLNNFKNSTSVTSLVGGTLESLSSANDPNYFEPISILMLPRKNYKYTLVSEDFNDSCSGGSDFPLGLPLSSQPRNNLCSIFLRHFRDFELKYASACNSSKNCTPFGGIGYLPQAMSLNSIQCSSDERKLQVLIEFAKSSYAQNYQPFNPNTTLVGEGSWDKKRNRLCIIACRILNATDSWANASVEDCSIKLSLRFPAIWSIRDTSNIVGQIWSNKTVNESGYFEKITFRKVDNNMQGLAGLKYEYTKIDSVRKSCPNSVKGKKGKKYPNAYSYDMRFDMSVKSSKRKIGWGYSVPISVGDRFYQQFSYSVPLEASEFESSVVPANFSSSNPLNISYKIGINQIYGAKLGSGISLFNISSGSNYDLEISAEGIYDAETGSLCMVGCRNLGSYNRILANDSMDCEILVNFQFPPYSEKNRGNIKGSIESTRKKSDPLYFDRLDLSSSAFYTDEAKQSIWRMDVEVTMVLITNTLACVFLGLQLFYVKKQPDMLSFMSLVMLLILTMGHMIPLLLNFEAMFLQSPSRQNVFLGSGGWVEVNEVIVRVVTMVAFLLEFRLLQLTWAARLGDGNQKALWAAEKKAVIVSLPLYVVGASITLLVNWRRNTHDVVMLSSRVIGYQEHSLWKDLKSYGGLILDGFLLPQILLNIFGNASESALSRSFYIGTTFVRLLPHAYDLYRAHSYIHHYDLPYYIYANPSADFYSTAWDVIIPFVGLLFAVIIYLQQRFGGHCILPKRLKESIVYEKVPVVSHEAQLPERSCT